jgi:hypothetical protein
MSGEVTVPLLPCASVDEIVSFLRGAGVSADVPAAAAEPVRDGAAGGLRAALLRDRGVRRGGLVRQLCRAGARCRRGARGVRGGVAGAVREGAGGGIPRMTRPRRRKNAGNLSGFTVVDPGGNWIRIFPAAGSAPAPAAGGRLAVALDNAVVLDDSQGGPAQAAKGARRGVGAGLRCASGGSGGGVGVPGGAGRPDRRTRSGCRLC